MKIKNIKVGPKGELFFYDTLREYRFFVGLFLILSALPVYFFNEGIVFPSVIFIILGIASIWIAIKNPPLLTIADKYIKFIWKKEIPWSQISSVDYKRDSVGNQCFDFLIITTKDNQTYKLNFANLNEEEKGFLIGILKKHSFAIKLSRDMKIQKIKVGPNGEVYFYNSNDVYGVLMITMLAIVVLFGVVGAFFVVYEKGVVAILSLLPAIMFPLLIAFTFKDMFVFAIENGQEGKNSIIASASDKISWQQISNISYEEKDNINLLIFKTQDDKEYKLDITALNISKKELLMKVLREHGLK